MKSLLEVKTERENVEIEYSSLRGRDVARSKITSLRKRAGFLKMVILYLEKEPSEEFVKQEVARVRKLISAIDDRFQLHISQHKVAYKTLSDEKAAKKDYFKEYGVNKMKEQLKTLTFILK